MQPETSRAVRNSRAAMQTALTEKNLDHLVRILDGVEALRTSYDFICKSHSWSGGTCAEYIAKRAAGWEPEILPECRQLEKELVCNIYQLRNDPAVLTISYELDSPKFKKLFAELLTS